MRIYLLFIIILLFGIVGFEVKRKYVEQKNVLLFLKSFIEFLRMNIVIYKNNIQEIINNYIIMQNNKNAKYINILLKNNKITQNNIKNINSYILDNDLKQQLNLFFNYLGKEDLFNESKKIDNMLLILENCLSKSNNDIKVKGDLYFKILLAIGIVLSIVLW